MAQSMVIQLVFVLLQTQTRLCPLCWFATVLCGRATERCLTLQEAWGSLAVEAVRVEDSAEMSPHPFHIRQKLLPLTLTLPLQLPLPLQTN